MGYSTLQGVFMSEEGVSEKKSFFDDKYTLIFFGILVFGFILRLIYFNANQSLWWDEADWLSIAKHWAFGVPFDVSTMRPPFFPAIVAFLYVFGANELVIRIFMLAVSVAGIYLTYLIARDLFDKRVALVSSLLISVSYVTLFYTARILLDIPMMVMWLLAIWFFWKGYVRKESRIYLYLMGVIIALGASMKLPFVLIGIPLLVYVFLNEGFSLFKNKALWLSIFVFFLAILPYFIYFNISYGGLPFISTPSYGFGQGQLRFGDYASLFPLILQSPIPYLTTSSFWILNLLLLLFLAGVFYMAAKFFLGWDLVGKEKSLKTYALLLAWIVTPYIFFSFVEWVEDRYLLMVYPAVFMVASFMLVKCYDFLKRYKKYVALVFVLLVLFNFTYYQVSYADNLIKGKASSYVQFKYAGLWMKERTSKDDLIFNSGIPQNTYYSERNTSGYPDKIEDFERMVAEYKPRYMVLSALERSPDWSYGWPEQKKDEVKPVLAYYSDEAQQKAVLVVYEFVYNATG